MPSRMSWTSTLLLAARRSAWQPGMLVASCRRPRRPVEAQAARFSASCASRSCSDPRHPYGALNGTGQFAAFLARAVDHGVEQKVAIALLDCEYVDGSTGAGRDGGADVEHQVGDDLGPAVLDGADRRRGQPLMTSGEIVDEDHDSAPQRTSASARMENSSSEVMRRSSGCALRSPYLCSHGYDISVSTDDSGTGCNQAFRIRPSPLAHYALMILADLCACRPRASFQTRTLTGPHRASTD